MTAPPAPRTVGQHCPGYQQGWTSRAREVLGLLPAGTVETGRRSIERGLMAAGVAEANHSWATEAWVAERLVEPLLLVDDWPPPSQPLPVGGGAVHADLTDDDHELFAGLRQAMTEDGTRLEAEVLAAAAQELRLPVTPYRRPADTSITTNQPEPQPAVEASSGWRRSGPMVVDLTALWAGPLATSLLAELGARVIKVDPDCRPDGLRVHDPVYRTLNANKTIVDLDLRLGPQREHFESLLNEADLLVDSFSRRVMTNLDYGPDELRARFPQLSTLSIVAFPAGTAEQDWVSYGPGIHAASGLAFKGHDPTCGPQPAPIAYPDVLAGLSAFAAGAEALSARRGAPHREISLAGALEPLITPRGTP